MKEIDKDILEEVNKITETLISYNNKNNLSWMKVYKEVLKNLNIEDKYKDHRLLSNVVTKITILGYDIIDNPFKLEKYD